jgi:predicted NAD/FAD-binding protein
VKVAVVGTGIAGLVAARGLARAHDLTVFEAAGWIGGHAHTVDVGDGLRTHAVDTGFVVFNRQTYPRFCALLAELGVGAQASDMSLSVRCERTGLEYEGSGWNGLLARRTNALRPCFWRMLRDVVRFYREAAATLAEPDHDTTLGEFLVRGRYSAPFVEQHLVPMASAVWSAQAADVRAMPLRTLVRFFHNHGFLQVAGRPQWLTVPGGSRTYVDALVAPFRERIRLRTPVTRVVRVPGGVVVRTARGEERFDRVVLAAHADQSLRMLADATPLEREVLGAFAYQPNDVVLHADERLLPLKKRARASWNVHLADPPGVQPAITYWMNRLQRLQDAPPQLVTLNRTADIDPRRVRARLDYAHPLLSRAAVAAQSRHAEIDGVHGVHFCGAAWGNGFHEDGVRSGEVVLARFPGKVPARVRTT